MSASDGDIQPSDGVESVNGIGPSRGDTLRQNGYETVQDLQEASQEELAQYIPGNVAQSVKQQVGDTSQSGNGRGGGQRNIPNVAEAKSQARQMPGAIAKTVRVDGSQVSKVLEKEQEMHTSGASIEIHKG
jgi:large subunit ribosomal protein L32e